MKKLTCLLLCLAMACIFITSCSKDSLDQFKEDIDEYKDVELPEDREDVELDFYIICEERTTDNSMTTVERMINSHLSDIYKTTLDIHFLTAAEYENEMISAAGASGDDRADIVLIVNKGMFDKLYNDNLLAELTTFYSTNKYGKLNTQIAGSLLRASLIYEENVDSFGTKYIGSHYYTVPNNHVVGEYEYILIDKEEARWLNYSNEKLAAMTTYESTAELRAALGDKADECVKAVSGTYTDKAKYEAEGYCCNVASYPIADTYEAFLSAFSIIKHPLDVRHEVSEEHISAEAKKAYNNYYDRCMEIIYALNTDEEFRNLLQYGVKGTNYSIDDNGIVTPYTEGNGVYNMNLLYTGDVFKAYYSDAIGWTDEVALNGVSQNIEAKIPDITVTVVNENGEAVEGVSVVICHNVTLAPKYTDKDGKVYDSFAPGATLKVAVKSVPKGYELPSAVATIDGVEYHAVLQDGVYTVTIVLPEVSGEASTEQ